ncbi:MAG TPA: hypothetical protein VK658_01655 [Chryseolinea sp.]|nr:hypothetical protein [Chryseolinea sp.]
MKKVAPLKVISIAVAIGLCGAFSNPSKAQTAAADNRLSQTITFRPIPTGPTVLGVFEGRPPCDEIARQLKISTPPDCIKLKWDLILYQDPATLQPTTYTLLLIGGGDVVKQPDGSSYQQKLIKGNWTIMKDIKANPGEEVYRLELATDAYLYLLKGDDNVLFVLDENKEFRVGNEDFSYTLNRVKLVPGNR